MLLAHDENTLIEYKSIRVFQKGESGMKDLAATCVCLANAQGGVVYIGIEDEEHIPPPNQIISEKQINDCLSRIRSLCSNVGIQLLEVETHTNGGQYFGIRVLPSIQSIAQTSDGRIYMRVGDTCQPVRADELQRLAAEKGAFQWEVHRRGNKLSAAPEVNLQKFANGIRESERVKESVKQLSDIEIAEHYNLSVDGELTNLGVLWLGSQVQRSRLQYPITVQYIVYDDTESKIRKLDWHDNLQDPKELILEIERDAVELTYYDEFPQGLFRKQVRHYDARIIRELLVNAIAHKSFTIAGDIFIKVFPDRLEISNPGGLPLGVTGQNILHQTSRRNPHLIRILHDLGLMEGEGSGYNLMYEITSRDGKNFPVPTSTFDSLTVTQYSNIFDPETLQLMDFITKHYHLSQKEFIAVGVVSRHKKILATQLAKELQLTEEDRLRSYTQRLLADAIIISRGVKKGTEYLVNPKLISNSKIDVKPTLKVIEPPRLKALVEETLRLSPPLKLTELHTKLGDVALQDVRKCVYQLVKEQVLDHSPDKKHRKYWLAKKNINENKN